MLSHDEQQRCARFACADQRRRYVTARWTLRDLLARYLGCPATAVRFAYNAHGKPSVAHPAGSSLHFNLSHSHELAVFAFALDTPVGIDLEHVHPGMPWIPVARRYYSESEIALLQARERRDRLHSFLQIWTFKESYVKARGLGLGGEMHHVCAAADAGGGLVATAQSEAADMPWSIHRLDLGGDYVAALSVARPSGVSPRLVWQ
jgi:4'-phosphopantetheinyl transferase